MKQLKYLSILLSCCGFSGTALAESAVPTAPMASEVEAISRKVADWQIATYADMARYREIPEAYQHQAWRRSKPHDDNDWTCAALHLGLYHLGAGINEPAYHDWLEALCAKNAWKLRLNPKGHEHADDHAMGQVYLYFYEESQDSVMIHDLQSRFDGILGDPKGKHRMAWSWCDALFMGPATWARLAKVTGDTKYLDYMDAQYHRSYDRLYNQEEHLFYRDLKRMESREKNGSHEYWARGNGWVFGGLAYMIPDLPADWAGRSFYLNLFKEMAVSLKTTQRADGTWSMGMLGDVADYPLPETSGTAFFVFGLAWGVNEGILERSVYEPVIMKGWNAMVACVNEDGMLGYVQGIGAAPGNASPDYTEVYGIGGFLAAGAEVLRLVK